MAERFDVIVVGAGPAGCSAAIVAARAGLSVLVIERGPYAGAKNMTGGMLLAAPLAEIAPDYWQDAPLERPIVHHRVMMASGERAMTLDIANDAFARPPYNGFSVLRGRLDRWMAAKAEQAGALILPSTVVDDLVFGDGGSVSGVIARRDAGEIRADVVILADGVNSLLARKAGLRDRQQPQDFGVGFKELLSLPAETIEDRFGLAEGTGAAYAVLGDFAKKVPGGGFIYTNKDSVSLGIVAHPLQMVSQKAAPNDLIERFKSVPEVARLIQGAELVEYSGHLIGEGGYAAMPKLYGPGVLVAGDAGGFMLNTGLLVTGMNLAISSGCCAGKAAVHAHEMGDFSKGTMAFYGDLLEDCVALSAMKVHRAAPDFMHSPRLYDEYPDIVNDILEQMVTMGAGPVRGVKDIAKDGLRGIRKIDLVRDLMKGVKAL